MTAVQQQISAVPRAVHDPRFREAVRERLVVLPQNSPGLAIRINGIEKAVVLFPREGRVGVAEALLNFVWLSVDITSDESGPLEFTPMSREETVSFLSKFGN